MMGNQIRKTVDEDQAFNVATSDWTVTWLIGSGAVMDPGEQVEIVVTLTGMTPLLGTNKNSPFR